MLIIAKMILFYLNHSFGFILDVLKRKMSLSIVVCIVFINAEGSMCLSLDIYRRKLG